MPADPLFVDLRIGLDNAEPLRKLLVDHLAATDGALTVPQRVLIDAGAAQVVLATDIDALERHMTAAPDTNQDPVPS